VILTRKQKEDLVIKLAEEGKSTRYIAEKAHVSLKDIGTILRRYTGEEEEWPYREKGLSTCSRAFKLFKEGRNKVDVAIALDIDTDEVLGTY
jgi:transposase